MKRTLLTLAIVTVAGVVSAYAHHSFAAHYFENQSITLQGDVQEFRFESPHALLMFNARTPRGQMATYTAEWGNPRRLGSQGLNKDTLRPGDTVIVSGAPGRAVSENRIHLKGIRRPSDGWSWGEGGRR